MTDQEKVFLRRVAITLSDRDPTVANIADAMRDVCKRDHDIVSQLLALDMRTRPRQYHHGTVPGTGEESPLSTLTDQIYHRLRGAAPPRGQPTRRTW